MSLGLESLLTTATAQMSERGLGQQRRPFCKHTTRLFYERERFVLSYFPCKVGAGGSFRRETAAASQLLLLRPQTLALGINLCTNNLLCLPRTFFLFRQRKIPFLPQEEDKNCQFGTRTSEVQFLSSCGGDSFATNPISSCRVRFKGLTLPFYIALAIS